MSWVVAIAGPFGYSTLFLGLALEYLGFPVPGEGILLVGGLLAGQGYLRLSLALPLILLGVVSADTLWFWLGRRRGPTVVRAVCRLTRNSSGCIGRVERTYQRLGLASILCGKFLPGIRQLIPALAGTFRVPYPLFFLLDLLGTTTWVLVFWSLGRTIGGLSPWDAFSTVGLGLVGFLALGGLLSWWLLRARPKAAGARLTGSTPGGCQPEAGTPKSEAQ
ncbi:MAG TPA: DedA family protein [Candidatus Methylomirabilis sp.]|nr:DedA family protein [Candidatus Methylomirabilis sp.]